MKEMAKDVSPFLFNATEEFASDLGVVKTLTDLGLRAISHIVSCFGVQFTLCSLQTNE